MAVIDWDGKLWRGRNGFGGADDDEDTIFVYSNVVPDEMSRLEDSLVAQGGNSWLQSRRHQQKRNLGIAAEGRIGLEDTWVRLEIYQGKRKKMGEGKSGKASMQGGNG